jgi:hypothetical protein
MLYSRQEASKELVCNNCTRNNCLASSGWVVVIEHKIRADRRTWGAEEPTPQAILLKVLSGQSGGPGMDPASACMAGREQQ